MRTLWMLVLGAAFLCSGCAGGPKTRETPAEGARTVYARCNLKVLGHRRIPWKNWQSVPEIIPVGTRLELSGGSTNWDLRDPETGRVYTLEAGAAGEKYLSKWVRETPLAMDFPPSVVANVEKQIAVVGMTREQVFVSMGPPTIADGTKSYRLTEEQVFKTRSWVYARRRFGKNIGVVFSPTTGLVISTEGIWKKSAP
ncbi:MAG: hypothetical protein ABFS86_15190 [Planctomycetota bacterium]